MWLVSFCSCRNNLWTPAGIKLRWKSLETDHVRWLFFFHQSKLNWWDSRALEEACVNQLWRICPTWHFHSTAVLETSTKSHFLFSYLYTKMCKITKQQYQKKENTCSCFSPTVSCGIYIYFTPIILFLCLLCICTHLHKHTLCKKKPKSSICVWVRGVTISPIYPVSNITGAHLHP